MPVTSPVWSTRAPHVEPKPDAAAVSRRPLVVGPADAATKLSVDATRPLVIHGAELPGLGAPTTQTTSPALGACAANCAGSANVFEPDTAFGPGSSMAAVPGSTSSRTRSVVASRPRTRAGWTTPSAVVTS